MVIPYLRHCSRPAHTVFKSQCRRRLSVPASPAAGLGLGKIIAPIVLGGLGAGGYYYYKYFGLTEHAPPTVISPSVKSFPELPPKQHIAERAATIPTAEEEIPVIEPVVVEELVEEVVPEVVVVVEDPVPSVPLEKSPVEEPVVVLFEEEPPAEEFVIVEVPVEIVPVVAGQEEEVEVTSDVVREAVEELNTLLDEISFPITHAEITEEAEEEAAFDDRILEALQSSDYEPVLSDSILEILVGKAANREKAVVATISRLENSMAGVVAMVQKALEHHNNTAALVAVAKEHAQAVSEATSKGAAKDVLEQLVESSAAVREAFQVGEAVDSAVSNAFNKLTEVIEKAENFNLQGPAAAARALLSKSKQDYFSSCQTAQEHHIDHALLAHYQQSVANRRKVLDRELEVLREHFPTRHDTLNQTFEHAGTNRARVEELNTLITYLSSKVSRLEGELESQQTSELQKLRDVAQAQKEEDDRVMEERLKAQAEQLKYQHEITVHTEVENAVAGAREEAARHSERQAELLKQEMKVNTDREIRNLTSFWSDEAALREATVEVEYQGRLEKSKVVLEKVRENIQAQNGSYDRILIARRLLNLTTDIYETVNAVNGPDNGKLKATVDCLRSEFSTDSLVDAVTSSMTSSLAAPLASFGGLSAHLNDLEPQCRKVALVTGSDCGFGSRVASLAMATLTVRDYEYDTKPEDGGCATFYHLTKAQSEMRANNLDLAARHVNQMEGEPRSLVMDWLRDARALLELQQSAKVLLNYAKSLNH